VVAQRLLPRKEDDGRITVVEVLVSTPAARACLRDADKLEELEEEIESGEEGMQTFAQHAGRLVKEGEVAKEAAQILTGVKGSRRGER
jgi:twitching motility protein PilT